MAKTLIDVDEQALDRAKSALGTSTTDETVNRALSEVVALAARRHNLKRFHPDGVPDVSED